MFFGAKARFGIECQFKTFTEPRRPIWGEIWIWAGGQRLGDEPSHADVGLVALMLCASLAERTGPEDETLAGSNKDDIWNTIYDGLYGSTDDKTADKVMRDSERYQKFLVCGGTEGFDAVFAVLVQDARGARLIWKSHARTHARALAGEAVAWEQDTHEVLLNSGEYESVITSFLNWLEIETGFRPEIRDWVELSENQREAIRQDLIKRRPRLARPDRRLVLDRTAREEFGQGQAQRNATVTGAGAANGNDPVP